MKLSFSYRAVAPVASKNNKSNNNNANSTTTSNALAKSPSSSASSAIHEPDQKLPTKFVEQLIPAAPNKMKQQSAIIHTTDDKEDNSDNQTHSHDHKSKSSCNNHEQTHDTTTCTPHQTPNDDSTSQSAATVEEVTAKPANTTTRLSDQNNPNLRVRNSSSPPPAAPTLHYVNSLEIRAAAETARSIHHQHDEYSYCYDNDNAAIHVIITDTAQQQKKNKHIIECKQRSNLNTTSMNMDATNNHSPTYNDDNVFSFSLLSRKPSSSGTCISRSRSISDEQEIKMTKAGGAAVVCGLHVPPTLHVQQEATITAAPTADMIMSTSSTTKTPSPPNNLSRPAYDFRALQSSPATAQTHTQTAGIMATYGTKHTLFSQNSNSSHSSHHVTTATSNANANIPQHMYLQQPLDYAEGESSNTTTILPPASPLSHPPQGRQVLFHHHHHQLQLQPRQRASASALDPNSNLTNQNSAICRNPNPNSNLMRISRSSTPSSHLNSNNLNLGTVIGNSCSSNSNPNPTINSPSGSGSGSGSAAARIGGRSSQQLLETPPGSGSVSGAAAILPSQAAVLHQQQVQQQQQQPQLPAMFLTPTSPPSTQQQYLHHGNVGRGPVAAAGGTAPNLNLNLNSPVVHSRLVQLSPRPYPISSVNISSSGSSSHHGHHGNPGISSSNPGGGTSIPTSTSRTNPEILKTLLRKKACLYEADTSKAIALITWLVGRKLGFLYGYFSRQQLQAGVHHVVAKKIDSGIVTRTKVNRCMQIILNSCFHYIIPRPDGIESGDVFRREFFNTAVNDEHLLETLSAPWNGMNIDLGDDSSILHHPAEGDGGEDGVDGDGKRMVLLCFNDNVRSFEDAFRCHNEFIRDTANTSNVHLSAEDWQVFFAGSSNEGEQQQLQMEKREPLSLSARGVEPLRQQAVDSSAITASSVANVSVAAWGYNDQEVLGQMSAVELCKFRTSWCAKRYDHDPKLCAFGHVDINRGWLRRDPSVYNYSEKLCPYIVRSPMLDAGYSFNACPNGLKCGFAHSKEECLYHPRRYKSALCSSSDGPFSCPLKEICPHLHTTPLMPATCLMTPRSGSPRGAGRKQASPPSHSPRLGPSSSTSVAAVAPAPAPMMYVNPSPDSDFDKSLGLPGLRNLFRRRSAALFAACQGDSQSNYSIFGDDMGIGAKKMKFI